MAKRKKSEEPISNVDVVVLAAHLAGAHITPADTEDIAMLANEIAPGRFSWRKYKDQINLEHVRVTLTDARKLEKGALLEGNISDGWRLTESGMVAADRLRLKVDKRDLSRLLKRDDQKRQDAWLKRERARMLSSPLINRLRVEGVNAISRREAETFFKIDEYVVGDDRQQKVKKWLVAFELDKDLSPVVRALAERILGDEK